MLLNILLFLFVAGKLKSFEYDCTFSAAFLKSSTLRLNGIASLSYRSQITEPSSTSDIIVGITSLSVISDTTKELPVLLMYCIASNCSVSVAVNIKLVFT